VSRYSGGGSGLWRKRRGNWWGWSVSEENGVIFSDSGWRKIALREYGVTIWCIIFILSTKRCGELYAGEWCDFLICAGFPPAVFLGNQRLMSCSSEVRVEE
jgi:hypothetical protein